MAFEFESLQHRRVKSRSLELVFFFFFFYCILIIILKKGYYQFAVNLYSEPQVKNTLTQLLQDLNH